MDTILTWRAKQSLLRPTIVDSITQQSEVVSTSAEPSWADMLEKGRADFHNSGRPGTMTADVIWRLDGYPQLPELRCEAIIDTNDRWEECVQRLCRGPAVAVTMASCRIVRVDIAGTCLCDEEGWQHWRAGDGQALARKGERVGCMVLCVVGRS